ncbi:hypothetical protein I3843_08G111200 [Carya illinoinensis]|nr:hypothetical protein I3843_08G111200 [Carya illinoinensis]
MSQFRELVVESKRITIASEGVNFRLTERGWKEKYEVVVYRNTLLWLVRALEECLRGGNKEMYSVVREGYRSFIAQRCANHRGRYLLMAEYGREGRASLLCFPEGYGGWEWKSLKEMVEEMTHKKVPVVKGDGNQLYRRSWKPHTVTYAEALTAAKQVNGEQKTEAVRQGGVSRATKTVQRSIFGRPKVGQETWVSSRRLLELQGQVRRMQRELEELRAYVGMKKEIKGKELMLGEESQGAGTWVSDLNGGGHGLGPGPGTAHVAVLEESGPSKFLIGCGPGPGPSQPIPNLSPAGPDPSLSYRLPRPADPSLITETPSHVLCTQLSQMTPASPQKLPTGTGGHSGKVTATIDVPSPTSVQPHSTPMSEGNFFSLCNG